MDDLELLQQCQRKMIECGFTVSLYHTPTGHWSFSIHGNKTNYFLSIHQIDDNALTRVEFLIKHGLR